MSLTNEELGVGDLICDAFNAFANLPRQHPDELRDFADATHRLQDILAMRCLRDCHPEHCPVKDAEWVRGHTPPRGEKINEGVG